MGEATIHIHIKNWRVPDGRRGVSVVWESDAGQMPFGQLWPEDEIETRIAAYAPCVVHRNGSVVRHDGAGAEIVAMPVPEQETPQMALL